MAKHMLTCIAACGSLALAASAMADDTPKKVLAATPSSTVQPTPSVNGQVPVVIKYRDGRVRAQSAKGESIGNQIEIRSVAEEDLDVELQKLRMDETVEYAEPNYITRKPAPVRAPIEVTPGSRTQSLQPGQEPNDPELINQYTWLAPTEFYKGQHAALKAVQAAKTNDRMNIGVIDSEFRITDDLQYAGGYNFSRLNSDVGPEYLEAIYEPDCPTSHGTAVANIIAAPTNNGIGMAGFADANVWAVRSMSCGTGFLFDTAESIRWLAGDPTLTAAPAIGVDIDIINASLGAQTGECPAYLQDAINYAHAKGIIVIAAAGNDTIDVSSFAPANCNHVITVGSVDRYGKQSGFTNFGDLIDVAALGEMVLSMTRDAESAYHFGTSFSAPNVAGMAALIKQTNPLLGPDEVADYLKSTAQKNPDDPKAQLGAGIVQPVSMVNLVADRYEEMRPTVSHVLDDPSRCNKEAYKTLLPDSVKPCQLYEVDASELPANGFRYTVFEADTDAELSASTATAVKISADPVFVVSGLQGTGKQYGIGLCDANGNNCTNNNLLPLGNEEIIRDRYCD